MSFGIDLQGVEPKSFAAALRERGVVTDPGTPGGEADVLLEGVVAEFYWEPDGEAGIEVYLDETDPEVQRASVQRLGQVLMELSQSLGITLWDASSGGEAQFISVDDLLEACFGE